jgi:TusA-related sulfurtransferase
MPQKKPTPPRNFKTTERANVPTGRNGKHKSVVTQILNDLEKLEDGQALKIPISDLPDTKVNIRSALNRATHKLRKTVATAADEEYLYVWNS